MAVKPEWLKKAQSAYDNSINSNSAALETSYNKPEWLKKAQGAYYLQQYNKLGQEISQGVSGLGVNGYVSPDVATSDRQNINSKVYAMTLIADELIYNPEKYGLTQEQANQFKTQHESTKVSAKTISDFAYNREKYYSGFDSEEIYNTNKKNAGYYDKYKNNTAEELADIITKLPEGSEEYQFAVDYRNSLLYNEYSNYSDEKMAEIEAEYNKYYDPNGRYQMLERKALNPHMSKITDAELRELKGMRARKREFESKYDYKLIEQVRAQDKAQKEYVLPYLEKPDFKENSSAIKVYGDKNFSFDDAVKYLAALPLFAWDTNFTRAINAATDNEKKVFAYIYNTQGQEAAKEWYENLRPTLQYRASANTQQEWKDFANENWFNAVLTQIAARGTNIIKGGVAISDIISNIKTIAIEN